MKSLPELVVLVDRDGTPIGTHTKHDVHDANTALHLAFSCYLFDDHDRILITRRSLAKKTWPGVWTNSFCGHPGPGETFEDAISRRAERELGAKITDVECELPSFAYRAVDASGVVENEICPVYSARVSGTIDPAPDEVCEWQWISFETLRKAVTVAPFAFSPWLREQLPQLASLGQIAKVKTDG